MSPVIARLSQSAAVIHDAAVASRAPTPAAGAPAPDGFGVYALDGAMLGWGVTFEDAVKIAAAAG